MLDELAVFKIVMERLNNAGINYMVSGSVAMNYYAQPRMTRDIDIIVELNYQNANKFYNLFQKDFYIDLDMMKGAISHKKVFNIIHSAEAIKVDFIIRKESKYRRMEFERRRKAKINETEFYIASIEDLILSKLVWAKDSQSEIQLGDVKNLLQEKVDLEYMKKWSEVLSIKDLLAEVLNE